MGTEESGEEREGAHATALERSSHTTEVGGERLASRHGAGFSQHATCRRFRHTSPIN